MKISFQDRRYGKMEGKAPADRSPSRKVEQPLPVTAHRPSLGKEPCHLFRGESSASAMARTRPFSAAVNGGEVQLPAKKKRTEGDGGGDGAAVNGGGRAAVEGNMEEVKLIGKAVARSFADEVMRDHYSSFEYKGNVYQLKDTVLFSAEHSHEKPYIAMIKDISKSPDGSVMVIAQWFYRPKEAQRIDGGDWPQNDSREVFYSFHYDEVPADAVMHKCAVHFVPLNEKLPVRSEQRGFIVQKVYDIDEKKLLNLKADEHREDRQREIDCLVLKTEERLVLQDTDPEDVCASMISRFKKKGDLYKKNAVSLDVSSGDRSTKSNQPRKVIMLEQRYSGDARNKRAVLAKNKAGKSYVNDATKNHADLAKFKAFTGDPHRSKWLDKLVEGIQHVCNSNEDEGREVVAKRSEEKDSKLEIIHTAIVALEHTAFVTLGGSQKYNQKMRQMDFNLKNNKLLAMRLLKKELAPAVLLTMSPDELKNGLTAEERPTDEPERTKEIQMTGARCSRCSEKNVGITDIIHAGARGDRYHQECLSCGHTWYASRDSIIFLAADEPSVDTNVGTSSLAPKPAKPADAGKNVVAAETSKKSGSSFAKPPRAPTDISRKYGR